MSAAPGDGTFTLGPLTVRLLDDGPFRLDGGAMFGVVPKPLWARHKPADDRNRIAMVTNCVLVSRGDAHVLIDTGIGDKHDAKFCDLFGVDPDRRTLPQQLDAVGIAPEQITDVVLTHLHFDHCGWNTRRDGDRVVPTFPRARYWLQRGEVDHARAPNVRDRASYLPDNWEPLFEADQVALFDDAAEVVPGVVVHRAPGHNADMCIVTLNAVDDAAEGETGVIFADLVPTAAHVPPAWVMGYDLYPLTTVEHKTRWVARAAAGGWRCIFTHETEAPVRRLVESRPGRFVAQPWRDAGTSENHDG
ncbi:MAG: MBL fold metallo-hydrolase [Acidobacteriota bacterium]